VNTRTENYQNNKNPRGDRDVIMLSNIRKPNNGRDAIDAKMGVIESL
jgi:hypothetical protein